MEYLNEIISKLYFLQTVSIYENQLYIHSNTSQTKYKDLLSIFKVSFIMFSSDIEIYEILITHKKYIKFDIFEHTHKIKEVEKSDHLYGVTIIGTLKKLFAIALNNRLYLKDTDIVKSKNLRKRMFFEVDMSNISVVGTFNNEFIILEISNILYAIDQHGLHERILYERFSGEEKLRKKKACREAIKFGEFIKPEFVRYLINEMKRCQHPFICAHGRPIISKIDLF